MKTSFLKDTFLFSNIKNKNREAFLKAYDLYLDEIFRFVLFKVSSEEEAEDVTSQVFLRAWNHIQNDNDIDEETLRAWFYKIARNTVIDHYRYKNKTKNTVSTDEGETTINVPSAEDIFSDMAIKSEHELVMKKINGLKDEYKEVIIMRYVEELSIPEIAHILKKSKGNVRILTHRALRALKDLLES